MAQANNKQAYIDGWQEYMAQLYSVYQDADKLDQWENVRNHINFAINQAADNNFPEPSDLPPMLRVQAS